MASTESRRTQAAAIWVIYAAVLCSAVESMDSKGDIAAAVGGFAIELLLPYVAGGFASDFAPVRGAAYLAGAAFAANYFLPRLRFKPVALFSLFLLYGTTLFTIWLDRYVSLRAGILDYLIGLITGGAMTVVDLAATSFWTVAYLSTRTAIRVELKRQPRSADATGEEQRPFFYGTVMYALALGLSLVALTPAHLFIVFLTSMRNEFGIENETFGTSVEIGRFLALLALPAFGARQDRIGSRRALTRLTALLGIACAASGWIRIPFLALGPAAMPWALGLTCFALQALGYAIMLGADNTLSYWYEKRLGRMEGAFGVRHALISIATIPNFAAYVASVYEVDWKWIMVVAGLVITCLICPLVRLLHRESPADVGRGLDGTDPTPEENATATPTAIEGPVPTRPATSFTLREALRTPAFWSIAAVLMIVPCCGEYALVRSIRPFEPGSENTMIFNEYALCMALGCLAGGFAADRAATRRLLPIAAACCIPAAGAIGELWSWPAPLDAFRILSLASGFTLGATAPAWVRFFGTGHLGMIRGVAIASTQGGILLLVAAAGRASGAAPWILLPLILAAAVASALFAAPPRRPTPTPESASA